MSELVEDLEHWLDEPAYMDPAVRGRELDRASWLIGRACDEIVALRNERAASERVWLMGCAAACTEARAEALEEAAVACLRKARDHVIPIGQDNYHDGCVSCAAAIRALKNEV